MKNLLITTALFSTSVFANTPLEQFQALNQAAIQQDIQAMNQMLADDFTLTHITDYAQPKAEWLKEVETGSMRYFAFKELETDTKIHGNRATVYSKNVIDANIWGMHRQWNVAQTVELEQINGNWIIKKSVARSF